jgi:hypothetical protein
MTIALQIHTLQTMTVLQLREKYLEVVGEPTRSGNSPYLIRKIAWKIQETAFGGVSERAKARALEIADEGDLRVRPPRGYGQILRDHLGENTIPARTTRASSDKEACDPRLPAPGTVLTKDYRGRSINVLIRGPRQFEWEGRFYPSLSAIAREVTGTRYNGFTFFGLRGKERS